MAKKKKRESIVESIIEGIQERKGESITVVDLTGIEDTVCRYFVICQGGTPNQTLAIEDSIRETVRVKEGRKPDYVEGTRYAHWIAMDYGDVMVHIFIPNCAGSTTWNTSGPMPSLKRSPILHDTLTY